MSIDLMQNEIDHETIQAGDWVFISENLEGDVVSGAFIGKATETFTNDSDRIVEVENSVGERVVVYAFSAGKIN